MPTGSRGWGGLCQRPQMHPHCMQGPTCNTSDQTPMGGGESRAKCLVGRWLVTFAGDTVGGCSAFILPSCVRAFPRCRDCRLSHSARQNPSQP